MTLGPTAFVLAGGGSLGAVQVGMLQALVEHGVKPDLVVGSSVGSINAAYYAGRPDEAGVAELARIWRRMTRDDIFPLTAGSLARFVWRRDFLVSAAPLRRLIEGNLPYRTLEEAKIPLHVVATDFLSGRTVVLSKGEAASAILASCAIPAAFAPVAIANRPLADGGIASNTPVRIAVEKGAKRLIVLPTGFSCALTQPPPGAIASAFQALTLLISGQLINELEALETEIDYHVVPSLCPLGVSSYDFSHTSELIDRARTQTEGWLDAGGLSQRVIPNALRAHSH
jgi:NTE family protein